MTDELERRRRIEALLAGYVADDLPKDSWDVDTAVESPQAMGTGGAKKRSGEYLKHEFAEALKVSKKAVNK